MDNKILVQFQDNEEVRICDFPPEEIDSFVEIHIENLFSKSKFSQLYLRERFYYLLQCKSSVMICAKNNTNKVVGLVYGGDEGYKNEMNKFIMKKMFWIFVKEPYLLMSDEFIYKYRVMIAKLVNRLSIGKWSSGKTVTNLNDFFEPPKPTLRLTGIAVLEEFSHMGVGNKLLTNFINIARLRKYKSVILETPQSNIRASNFYEKSGFIKYISKNQNDGKVYYYKIII